MLSRILLASALSLAVAGPACAADPEAGHRVFQAQCATCHLVKPGRNLVGPTLFGVVGRRTASVPGFGYSDANRAANIVWDGTALDAYLKSPLTVMPGTSMGYAGLDDDGARANLIAYLATLK